MIACRRTAIFFWRRLGWHPLRRARCVSDICAYVNAGLWRNAPDQPSSQQSVSGGAGNAPASCSDSLLQPQVKSLPLGSDSGIGKLAAAINRGDRSATCAVFQQGLAI
ncbi:hypothetical protein KCP73_17465 [Salmonella enterica subsp. enterica]|nr:hypothetical protein KCP73_17465 [Salmonella enterica subsp. enterica]